jgi:hypothetical protein
MNILHIIMR